MLKNAGGNNWTRKCFSWNTAFAQVSCHMINDENTHDEFSPIIEYVNMHHQTAFSAFYSLLVKVQTNCC